MGVLPKNVLAASAWLIVIACCFSGRTAVGSGANGKGLIWKHCGKARDEPATNKVTRISISPPEAEPDRDLRISFDALLGETLTGGEVIADFTSLKLREAICDSQPCPLGPGSISMNVTRHVPSLARSLAGERVYGKIIITNAKDKAVICVRVGVPIAGSSPSSAHHHRHSSVRTHAYGEGAAKANKL